MNSQQVTVRRHPEQSPPQLLADEAKDPRTWILRRPACGGSPQDDGIYTAIDFRELFGNDHPVEIEIGCGKGKFLMASAQACPEVNFLGLDRVSKWMKRRLEQLKKGHCPNLLLMKAEIRRWLEGVPRESVSVFHIYFPDPWPKRRHRKRRLINPIFLTFLYERLCPEGLVEMATDDADYYMQMKESAAKTEDLWKSMRESQGERLRRPEIKTNYELKFESQGKKNYYLELQR